MSLRMTRLSRRSLCVAMFLLAFGLGAPPAFADPIYSITDLGTLPGQTSSVATAVNNQGQVVGISYDSSDGSFADSVRGSAQPPRFTQTGSGAESFLYSNGQMTRINPTGGLATSINNAGQVVGGSYASINDAGQYVGGAFVGINTPNDNAFAQLVSGGTPSPLPIMPYSINSAGQVAGFAIINAHGGDDFHPATYQNGQVTDLFSKVATGEYYDSRAVAINQKGDVLITVLPENGTEQSYLYQASTRKVVNLTGLPGGSGMIAAALNNKDQVVGNGYLYSNGTIQALASLATSSSGWSNLVATGINDAGQIVGQGMIDGQEHAFLMTPDGGQVPEPGPLAVWGLISACLAARLATRRNRGEERKVFC